MPGKHLLTENWGFVTPQGVKEVKVPFRIASRKRTTFTFRKELDYFSEDAIVIPHIIADKAWIYLNETLIGEVYPPSILIHHSNFVFKIPEDIKTEKNTLVIKLSSEKFVALEKAPYLGDYNLEQIKSKLMEFFNSQLWLFAAGMGLILTVIVLLLERSPFVTEKEKYLGMGIALFGLTSLLILHFFRTDNIASIKNDMLFPFIPVTLNLSASSLVLIGVEHLTRKEFKVSRFMIFINVFLIIFSAFFRFPAFLGMLINFFVILYLALSSEQGIIFSSSLFLLLTLGFDAFAEFLPWFPPIQMLGYGFSVVMLNFGLLIVNDYRKAALTIKTQSDELEKSFNKLQKLHEELLESAKKLEATNSKFEELLEISANLVEYSVNPREKLLKTIFQTAMQMLPEADYGCVSLIKEGKWLFVDAVGHDLSALKQLPLKAEYFITPELVSTAESPYPGIYLIKDIELKNLRFPPEVSKDFLKSVKSIKESLVAELTVNGKRIGYLSLNISKNSDKKFSVEAVKIMKSLSSMASALLSLKELNTRQFEMQREIILSAVRMLEIHSPYTKGHSERVAKLSSILAKQLGLQRDEVTEIYWAALLHDMGKILVPADILNKTGKLTREEFEIVKMHPIWGADVLGNIRELKNIALYVRHHHERFDGKGYPDGLAEKDIPLASRIIAVVDSYDSMIYDRPYRKALKKEDALEEIKRCSGTQFDPEVAKAFLKLIKQDILDKDNSM
ncbi:HD-GYP domain-containing protein [Kosmotoga pacifica]|nr:HD-GYP domain-containing protein [Kosmotoga pacifica]